MGGLGIFLPMARKFREMENLDAGCQGGFASVRRSEAPGCTPAGPRDLPRESLGPRQGAGDKGGTGCRRIVLPPYTHTRRSGNAQSRQGETAWKESKGMTPGNSKDS